MRHCDSARERHRVRRSGNTQGIASHGLTQDSVQMLVQRPSYRKERRNYDYAGKESHRLDWKGENCTGRVSDPLRSKHETLHWIPISTGKRTDTLRWTQTAGATPQTGLRFVWTLET